MNEQVEDVSVLQSLVNYYRNKCFDLEYKFVLYQTKVEAKIKEFEKRLDDAGVSPTEIVPTKKRKPNEKT